MPGGGLHIRSWQKKKKEKKKKHSKASHAENKLLIGKGVSFFFVDVARVWLEVKALFTKE